MEQFDLRAFLVEVLERLGLEYFITGSVAAIFYGEPRLQTTSTSSCGWFALVQKKIPESCRMAASYVRCGRGPFRIVSPQLF